jgi:hypothetical protein
MEGASKKKQAEMQKKMAAQVKAQMGKYRNDIERIVGVHEGYIFATISDDDKEQITMDVISPDLTFYTQITMKTDEVSSAKLSHGKLILCLKNEEDGPYVNIYDLAIN